MNSFRVPQDQVLCTQDLIYRAEDFRREWENPVRDYTMINITAKLLFSTMDRLEAIIDKNKKW